ncbi:MAG TPA: tetratricopeptide repeat protein [Burkholderiaceae bacterium]
MPVLAGFIHLAIACYFGVHAIRSGQPLYWLFVLFAFPLLGSIVYFFALYLPSMRYTRGGIKAARAINTLIDPNRELREATMEFDRTPTAYNRSRLAAALLAKGDVDQAIVHYREAASGPYATDVSFLTGLAGAQLQGGRFGEAADTLQRLFDAHPDQRRGTPALMHAEAVAGAGRPEARAVFEAVIAADNSTEARCKYGQFLLRQGDAAGARRAFEAVLEHARQGHQHSRELNRDWIAEAKSALKQLEA